MEALENSQLLLKFAAETSRDLPQDGVVVPLVAAWNARETDVWTPEVSTMFWDAYRELCRTLHPATVDTIEAQKPIQRRRWVLFGPLITTSLPRLVAYRFRLLLALLLCIATYLWFIGSFSDDVVRLVKQWDTGEMEAQESLEEVRWDVSKWAAQKSAHLEQVSLDDPGLPPETVDKVRLLRQRLQSMYLISDQLHDRLQRIRWLMFSSSGSAPRASSSRLPQLADGYEMVQSFYVARRNLDVSLQGVLIVNQFYYTIMPLVLGAIGACTHVLRLTSDQIRDVTFSTTSPVRHSLRVLLGALGGLAVGLGAIATSALSTAALSFIVGYAVEPVFSTFDAIVEKFQTTT